MALRSGNPLVNIWHSRYRWPAIVLAVLVLDVAGWAVVAALSGGCCKVCREGKACGDTCIAQDAECTEGPGCACDRGCADACCKVCTSKSKACGDTCIPRDRACDAPKGCACDETQLGELCR